ncbi:MAG: winged helix-turn-helix domain-containing protein [Candidatus Omnitrophica bacterium]|nr:winged helix-turn-helix domain-containing protein [Candidatus Omnitrophota bacterium]
MITEIGIAAGDIWHYLDHNGSATLDQLVRGIGKPRELLLMSLGWLAREGHVILGNGDTGFRSSLTKPR